MGHGTTFTLDEIAKVLHEVITEHTLTYQQDEEGNGYPLIDALSVGGDVEKGREEIASIEDEIMGALTDRVGYLKPSGDQDHGQEQNQNTVGAEDARGPE